MEANAMKPRARRVTIAAAALGVGVIGVFVIINWRPVREHIQAWHLQLTRETETITAGGEGMSFTLLCKRVGTPRRSMVQDEVVLNVLAEQSGHPVIWNPASARVFVVAQGEELRKATDALRVLKDNGWRVLEQRFPRRAYVVIREPQFIQDLEVNSTGVSPRINPVADPKETPREATTAE
jgi:hypothetical protein